MADRAVPTYMQALHAEMEEALTRGEDADGTLRDIAGVIFSCMLPALQGRLRSTCTKMVWHSALDVHRTKKK